METRPRTRSGILILALTVVACAGPASTPATPRSSSGPSAAPSALPPTAAPASATPAVASPTPTGALPAGLPPSPLVVVSTRPSDGQWSLMVLDRAGERTPVPFAADSMGDVAARPGMSEVALVVTLCEVADQPCGTIIVAVDLATGGARRLTPFSPGASDAGPAWSPDGSRLAFSSSRAGNELGQELYLAAAAGGDPVRLDTGLTWSAAPAWSPDGRTIAFVGRDADSQTSIYLVPAVGGEARRLASVDSSTPLSWSPDGTRIAYQATNLVPTGPNEMTGYASIAIVGVDDGVSTVLRATPSMNRTPTWSPDGSAIAFIVEGESPTAQLALIGPDGRDGRSLGNPAWDDRFLAWLP